MQYGIGEQTVRDIRRSEAKIRDARMKHKDPNAKHVRRTTAENLNNAVYAWFKQQRAHGLTISGIIIQAKELQIHSDLNTNWKFSASEGWLEKFKLKHGI